MRKIVAGNWKMNLNVQEANSLLDELIQRKDQFKNVEVLIAPPALYLSEFSNRQDLGTIALAAQNAHFQNSGAFTGEISPSMLSALQINYCLVGHSERRQYFNETLEETAKKTKALLSHSLVPIICIGEHLKERYEEKHFEIVLEQLAAALSLLELKEVEKVILAYEPVWAIGTGQTATAEQAQEMHAAIRSFMANTYGKTLAASIPILYGGSCNAANAKELFQQTDIDGGLIGGAALKPDDFLQIIQSF